MAHVLTTATLPARHWSDLRGRFAGYRVYRQTLADLRRLSPEELEDVGLGHVEIRDIARVAAAAQH